MILLLGGTSETAPLAQTLAESGITVLVSTATNIDLDIGHHERITRRTGKMKLAEMKALVIERSIAAILDATHPYAEAVSDTAQKVAAETGIPYFAYCRPETSIEGDHIIYADTHTEAAKLSCKSGATVLLTIGSNNVAPYATAARQTGCKLYARILNFPDSINACVNAGLDEESIITGRGPFSTDENRALIQKHSITILVSKDSGKAGGVPEKVEAARLEDCKVVLVKRAPTHHPNSFDNIKAIINQIKLVVI